MIFGEFVGLKFPDICFTGEEKPRKIVTQETCPGQGSNPGPLRDRRACCRLAHSAHGLVSTENYFGDLYQKNIVCTSEHTAEVKTYMAIVINSK